ncbi:MAG: hypothetical protein ACR2OC_04355 [Solirubrobacterales bacterium]
MSSDPHSDALSPAPEREADLVAERGGELLDGLDRKRPGSRAHGDRTASWAVAIAVELALPRETALTVREVARLHEIGLLYVEPGDDAQAHAAAKLAAGAGLPDKVCVWLQHWRERFDGGGPRRMFGGAIPLESRIIRAACAFATEVAGDDDPVAALERLGAHADTELDPATIGAIAFVLDRGAPGGAPNAQ